MTRLWALDIDEHGRPWRAHLITKSEQTPWGEERIAECGERFTLGNHPRGWWSMEGGRLPLQAHAIHCGSTEYIPNRKD